MSAALVLLILALVALLMVAHGDPSSPGWQAGILTEALVGFYTVRSARSTPGGKR